MVFLWLATLVVVVHLAFVLFVTFGALLVFRWPRVAWVHVPAALWGAWIEFSGWVCPLTPLELWLRARGGAGGYAGDFLDRYLVSLLYPEGLTRSMQLGLGVAVVAINLVVYAAVWRRRARVRPPRA